MIEALWLDFRVAVRRLGRNPAFSALAIVTLALGIGVNSAIFSLVEAVLLRPLPFADQERLVSVYERRNGTGQDNISGHEYAAWSAAPGVFEDLAVYRGAGLTLTGHGDASRVNALRVSANFFDVFGVRPVIGRGFRHGEDAPGADHVVVLGHAYWSRQFQGDSAVVGGDLALDNVSYRVIGVGAPGGEFDPDVWVPTNLPEEVRAVGRHALTVVGRLRSGVTPASAESALNAISARLEREMPRENAGHRAHIVPVYDDVVGDARAVLVGALGAVGIVLLIACANVAHLLLTRAVGRRREVAIRTAVGASRTRLIVHLLGESILLSVVGGGVGLLLAVWIVAIFPTFHAVHIPRLVEARVDLPAILATFGLAVITGIGSGLVPAVRASGASVTEGLAAGGRGTDRAGRRLADGLIVTEVALVMVLLVGAGLLVRSFAQLTGVPSGFDAHNVLVVPVDLAGARYPTPASQRDGYGEIARRIAALPGVLAVGGTTETPLAVCCNGIVISIEGEPPRAPGQERHALMQSTAGDYFAAMGIPLRDGRAFAASDARIALPLIRWWDQQPLPPRFDEPQAGPAAVINETMAREYWGSARAVGQRFRILASPWITVVGVVGDVHHRGLDVAATPELFLSEVQEPRGDLTLMIRTAGDPMLVARAVQAAVRDFDATVPVGTVTTLDAVVHDSIGRPRLNAMVLGAFALLALTLALVGIYGVTSHAVAQRTREIGIRAALGATPREVMRLLLGRTAMLTGIGIGIGLATSLALSRVLASVLFGVRPTDPVTFVGIAMLLAPAALVASYVPARRALRVDPLVALRND